MKKWALLLSTVIGSLSFAADYSCFGANPYWSLELNQSQNVYTADYEVFGLETGKIEMASVAVNSAETLSLRGEDSAIQLIKKSCDDGMTDTIYPYEVIFNLGSETIVGCCN